MFDEILSNGSVDFLRMNSCNCFVYRMNAGKYRLMNFCSLHNEIFTNCGIGGMYCRTDTI